MINNKSYILLFCGLIGLLCYFFLRPEIEFYSNGPIKESSEEIEEKILSISTELGFSADSLALLISREQHKAYIKQLQDTLGSSVRPSDLNKRNAHIQSWVTIIGPKNQAQGYIGNYNELYLSIGRMKIRHSNEGRIIRVNTNPENPNPTFIKGDSVQAVAANIVGKLFEYDLDDYELITNSTSDTVLTINEGQQSGGTFQQVDDFLEFNWKRNSNAEPGPGMLSLSLAPVVKEFNSEEGFRTEFGYSIKAFSAKNDLEPEELNAASSEDNEENIWFNYVFLAVVLVLVLLVFAIGIRNIVKGKVEWRRALFLFVTIAMAIYGWRAIYFMETYDPFLSNVGYFGSNLNMLLIALAIGLYASLAYISWEALARSQKHKQVDIIDALWQRKFFVSETGAALIHGFAIGGLAVGVFSILIYLTGGYVFQSDSQFGFTEASITPRLLTMNMSAWSNTWLVVIGQIGFVYALFSQWIKRTWLAGILSIIFMAIFTTVLGRLLGTSGTVFEDFLLYAGLAIVFIYTIKEFGLLTVSTGWWFFSIFFMIQPYWESNSIEVAYVAWVQAFIILGPLIYGFISYRFGVSVSEVGEYTPEYEERIAKHLRVEKEIEIARESQYKLMPLQPPKAEGFDVYGFFLPSFEVGGDYFDYILSEDEQGNPEALTMAVVDVSGKAMRAAMPAIFTSGLLLSRMKKDMPADILTQVSEPIFSRTDKRTFITCVLARYNLGSRKISIANAGHCRPVLKRKGVADFIQTPDPKYPLGIMPDVQYKAQEFTLKKGDFFLLYSDGLPEAVNQKGERYGFEEVPRLIERIDTEKLSANEIAQEIKRTVQKFSNYQLADDTTIICLKV